MLINAYLTLLENTIIAVITVAVDVVVVVVVVALLFVADPIAFSCLRLSLEPS